jgi:DNA-binding HxlR family transcriptional regulator
MRENTECGECNLVVVISECLKRIEECLKEECGDIELKEVAEELNKITPALSTVLSKWVPQIIYSLYLRKTMSFNELKKTLNVSSRVLSDKLKILEYYKIVIRTVKPEKPPKVYYQLTDIGKHIALALIPLLIIMKVNTNQYFSLQNTS